MDTFGPPVSKLLFHRAAGELEPSAIEPIAQLVGTRGPDHHFGIVSQQAKAAVRHSKKTYLTPCDAPISIPVGRSLSQSTAPLNANSRVERQCRPQWGRIMLPVIWAT